ncbi:unnamed protein product [Pleuronectes platessa]|uniref:Uncharacterized protein n=1 Tax=Pleuronectes platessa TaxID=8262 RepID=A0A9N7V1T2_PLEPL|nr:unnamed protein product [Pleuronectes platessa]
MSCRITDWDQFLHFSWFHCDDPAPISSSAHPAAALNRQERGRKESEEEAEKKGKWPLERGPKKMGCPPRCSFTGDGGVRRASRTLMIPRRLERGCWSDHLTLDDPAYVDDSGGSFV